MSGAPAPESAIAIPFSLAEIDLLLKLLDTVQIGGGRDVLRRAGQVVVKFEEGARLLAVAAEAKAKGDGKVIPMPQAESATAEASPPPPAEEPAPERPARPTLVQSEEA